jgi:hypothetical protein
LEWSPSVVFVTRSGLWSQRLFDLLVGLRGAQVQSDP